MTSPSVPYSGQIFTPQMQPIGQMAGTQNGEYPATDPENEPPLLEGTFYFEHLHIGL